MLYFTMLISLMLGNLRNSQKSSFLRKRIADVENLAAKEVAFVKKYYPLT